MSSLLLHRFRHNRRLRSTVLPAVTIVLLSLLTAIVVRVAQTSGRTLSEQATAMAESGNLRKAEQLYWAALQEPPVDATTLLGFLENRARLRRAQLREALEGDSAFPLVASPTVSDREIETLLARRDLSPEIATLGRFWYELRVRGGEPDPAPIELLADREPPVRWANHLLAITSLDRGGDLLEAARRFEREGMAFPREAGREAKLALDLLAEAGEWEELRKRASDPRFDAHTGPALRLRLAEQERNWPAILFWLWPASFDGVQPWPLLLAAVAALLWYLIATHLGRAREDAPGRRALYATSFVLGLLSIYPTLVLITLQELLLDFRPVGAPVPDAIYFIFGVGLREELCKLLLFLPLLPLLKRRNSRIEAMTCAALVGLGFAAEENIGYFHTMEPGAALARFLTANFLHMALTGLIGLSVYDTSRGKATESTRFTTVFPLAVALHGAYDFFLTSDVFAEVSFLAMALFVIIAQQFLRQLRSASGLTRQEGALRLFVISLAALSGVSYIYATTLAGPIAALGLVASGMLGVAILVVMFARELQDG